MAVERMKGRDKIENEAFMTANVTVNVTANNAFKME